MVLQLIAADLKKEKIETLIIPVCEDKDIHDNQAISSLIKLTRKIKEFRGRPDDELILHNLPDVGSKRVIFMGLGELAKVDREALRVVAGRAVKKCIQKDIY